MPPSIIATLAETELFSSLDEASLERLSTEVDPLHLAGGDQLFHQGDLADCLYVVVQGRLRVSVERPDGSEQVLGEVGRGDVIGEMALLTGERRSATARAVRDTELLRLGEAAFNRLVEQQPAMMMQLTRRMVVRYQNALRFHGSGVRSAPTTIAVVPTAREVPLSEFTKRLERALAAYGPVLRLNSDRIADALGPGAGQIPQDHSRNAEVAAWLVEQETKYRTVIYEADLARSAWTSRCLRQADRVLLVGSEELSPALGAVELAMQREGRDGTAVQLDLVLLHRERRQLYPGTKEWLAPRRADQHHHVVLESEADFGRLVRILTNRATGGVLGGGGARCFAEIGVLRAIREAGVEIDLIGGTSMGAYVAAQHAFGWDPEQMREFNKRFWIQERPLKEYTIPYVGLVTGNKVIRTTRAIYGDANLEDLGIPFFCCSTNITRATVMVHDRGPIWRWLGASMAVPGISPPLFENGDLLVDGAVLDNLPIDVMRQRFDGTVIAVDVSPVEDLRTDPVYTMCPPTWQILSNRLNPLAAQKLRVPTIFEILSRCASLGSVQQVEALKAQADLFLHPPIERFSMFDWDLIDDLVSTGYEYARRALANWGAEGPVAGRRTLPLRVTSTHQVA